MHAHHCPKLNKPARAIVTKPRCPLPFLQRRKRQRAWGAREIASVPELGVQPASPGVIDACSHRQQYMCEVFSSHRHVNGANRHIKRRGERQMTECSLGRLWAAKTDECCSCVGEAILRQEHKGERVENKRTSVPKTLICLSLIRPTAQRAQKECIHSNDHRANEATRRRVHTESGTTEERVILAETRFLFFCGVPQQQLTGFFVRF